MRTFAKQFLAIAGLTALEALRQPVTLLIASGSLAFIALMPILITHSLGDSQRIVRDSALALFFVTGLVLGAYSACATLTREIRRGTAGAVLSKPVGRAAYLLAKYAGIASAMALYAALSAVAILLSARTAAESFVFDWWGSGPLLAAIVSAYALAGAENFLFRRPFVSRAFGWLTAMTAAAFAVSAWIGPDGTRGDWGAALPWRVVPATILVTLAVLVLTGIALALATRLELAPTLVACSLIFLAGLVSDYLFGRAATDHAAAALLYGVVPNWQHFWAVDALNGGAIPWPYVGAASLYAALYLAGALSLGVAAFGRMEIR